MHKSKSPKTHSSIYSNSPAPNPLSPLAYRPFGSQLQKASVAPKTQTDVENEVFVQQKMEATRLEIQAKYGSITPEGQERLTVLQTKMDGLLNSRLEHARRFGHNIANIPLHRPDTPTPIQAKLTIGEPGDKYEQEADETARQVVQQIHQPQREKLQRESLPTVNDDKLQKKPERTMQSESLPESSEELQMKPQWSIKRESLPESDDLLRGRPMEQRAYDGGMAATPDLETSIQQARGRGQPLAMSIREPMEQAFGADLSGVKVHTDTQADQLNQSIQAKAFTTGQDVFFRQGEYNLRSLRGQELLAHELTHVVQQGEIGNTVQRMEGPRGKRKRTGPDAGNVAQIERENVGTTDEDRKGKRNRSAPTNEQDDIDELIADTFGFNSQDEGEEHSDDETNTIHNSPRQEITVEMILSHDFKWADKEKCARARELDEMYDEGRNYEEEYRTIEQEKTMLETRLATKIPLERIKSDDVISLKAIDEMLRYWSDPKDLRRDLAPEIIVELNRQRAKLLESDENPYQKDEQEAVLSHVAEVISQFKETKITDGCEARASTICKKMIERYPGLSKKGLTKYWLFAEPNATLKYGDTEWYHHVGTCLELNGKKYIADPVVSQQEAIPLEEWLNKLSPSGAIIEDQREAAWHVETTPAKQGMSGHVI